MLQIENLSVHYGGIKALKSIDIEVPDEKYLSPTKNILFPIKNIPPGKQAGISARYPYLP